MAKCTAFAMLLGAAITFPRLSQAVDVSSCAELAAVNRKTENLVTFTKADFACDEYTRLSIKSPAMVFSSSVGAVTFSNLAFNVFGSLTVEPDVEFTGIENAEKRGGALKVSQGASVVFEGVTKFTDVSVRTIFIGPGWADEVQVKGGAIYNKGDIVFMKDAAFTRCLNEGLGEVGSGPGGAVCNFGSMSFMADLVMDENDADDYFGGAEGGGIFNNGGDITVDGDATFSNNFAGRGASLYQLYGGTITVNGFSSFIENRCVDTFGGAVTNIGGEMYFKGGATFDGNSADNSGDGGIGGGIYVYDGASVVLEGVVTFKNNRAYTGGAILIETEINRFYTDPLDETFEPSSVTFPDDTLFMDNEAYGQCPDVGYAYDPDTCEP